MTGLSRLSRSFPWGMGQAIECWDQRAMTKPKESSVSWQVTIVLKGDFSRIYQSFWTFLLLSWRIFTVDILHFDCATGTCWGVEAVFWLSPSSIKSWHDWYPPIPITVTPMNNNWNQPKTLHHLPQNNNIETKLNSDLIKPWLNTTIKIH